MKLLLHALRIDWTALAAAVALTVFGLVTMNSFGAENAFFERQAIWLSLGIGVFFLASFVDWRFLRRTSSVVALYGIACGLLVLLLLIGETTQGARSWFYLGPLSFQPADLAKIALIVLLAKYFTRRHVEIAHVRHILVSGLYALVPFVLILLQPDFGSALILGALWFGVVFVSGISRKHLITVILLGVSALSLLWFFGFEPYQKARILTFLNPLTDIHGAGYNAYQSTITVGSGELFGKGIGYGTQSKLKFLPEYETDFIFAAFAEEWGFIGALLLFALFALLLSRIFASAARGATNFETLFALGVSIYFMSHFALHVGINIGLLPVTGTTIPFMSYGGSHLIIEYLALGMISGMRRYARAAHRDALEKEFHGGYSE